MAKVVSLEAYRARRLDGVLPDQPAGGRPWSPRADRLLVRIWISGDPPGSTLKQAQMCLDRPVSEVVARVEELLGHKDTGVPYLLPPDRARLALLGRAQLRQVGLHSEAWTLDGEPSTWPAVRALANKTLLRKGLRPISDGLKGTRG